MTENKKKFLDIIESKKYGIMPDVISADLAIQVLSEYLLGEDWYITDPVSQEQANTIIVAEILDTYSRDFRKDLNQRRWCHEC